ncbi:MAG: prepilin peptidase [Lentisphaeria bacterium]|nr:prepilin peptidase [Lentisphaeria bacterium]
MTFSHAYMLLTEHPVFGRIVWFWVGLCIGSFLNVCIWRVPNGMSLISPPSHCPKCDHPIRAWENIPILSWLFLRGKCSSCKQPISIRYPLVEGLTGLVFLGVFLAKSGNGAPALFMYSVTAAVLIAAAFTDCDYRIVPDGFVLTQLVALLVLIAWQRFGEWEQLALYLAATLIVPGILLSGFAMLGRGLSGKQVFGWGDVKLLTVLAPVLNLIDLLWLILIAAILALLIAPVYKKLKPKMRHRAIPFVPFIALAAGIVCLTPLTAKLGALLYPQLVSLQGM